MVRKVTHLDIDLYIGTYTIGHLVHGRLLTFTLIYYMYIFGYKEM